MSYCRWSCDGSKSDVYVYLDLDNYYVVNIRKHRPVIGEDMTAPIEYDGTNAAESYMSQLDYAAKLRDRPRITIVQRYAGETLYFEDIPSTLVFLRQLQMLNYWVPKHAFERLEHDYEEERKAAAAKAT